MTKILIVEDEASLVELLEYNLSRQQYQTCVVMEGQKVMSTLKSEAPDLILMDWMLPGISGVELCHLIRQNVSFKKIPVIMLTARSDEADKVKGLSMGADDYMTKPFSIPELMARIQALLRRTSENKKVSFLKAGVLKIDLEKKQVFRENHEIHLGPTEFKLLTFISGLILINSINGIGMILFLFLSNFMFLFSKLKAKNLTSSLIFK